MAGLFHAPPARIRGMSVSGALGMLGFIAFFLAVIVGKGSDLVARLPRGFVFELLGTFGVHVAAVMLLGAAVIGLLTGWY